MEHYLLINLLIPKELRSVATIHNVLPKRWVWLWYHLIEDRNLVSIYLNYYLGGMFLLVKT